MKKDKKKEKRGRKLEEGTGSSGGSDAEERRGRRSSTNRKSGPKGNSIVKGPPVSYSMPDATENISFELVGKNSNTNSNRTLNSSEEVTTDGSSSPPTNEQESLTSSSPLTVNHFPSSSTTTSTTTTSSSSSSSSSSSAPIIPTAQTTTTNSTNPSNLSCSSSSLFQNQVHSTSASSLFASSAPNQTHLASQTSSGSVNSLSSPKHPSKPKKKTFSNFQKNFLNPNLLGAGPSQNGESEQTPPKEMVFHYSQNEIVEIAKYLIDLAVYCSSPIDFFLAAFSNFDIERDQLFQELCNIYKQTRSNRKKHAFAYILKTWMSQSAALYDLQFNKFYQTIVTFIVKDADDSNLNAIKLMLVRGSNSKKKDADLPIMQLISQAQASDRKELVREIDRSELKPSIFAQYTPQEVAHELTFVMFRVFVSIGPAELHDGSWQGKDRMVRAPHLYALSLLFNRIAFLCIVEILYASSRGERESALTKCVELAQTLERMNNFEGMAAVVSVFGNASIQRLKPLWSGVGSKVAKKASKLEELLLPVKNYKAYMNVFSQRENPILPWLAPKLREVRFMYDGNPRFLEDKINWEFLQTIGRTINEYLKFKNGGYTIKSENPELAAILENVVPFDQDTIDDILYEQSVRVYSKK